MHLKIKDGRDGVRLAVDYRFVNRYTVGDAYSVPDIGDIIQRMGRAINILVLLMQSRDIGRFLSRSSSMVDGICVRPRSL